MACCWVACRSAVTSGVAELGQLVEEGPLGDAVARSAPGEWYKLSRGGLGSEMAVLLKNHQGVKGRNHSKSLDYGDVLPPD